MKVVNLNVFPTAVDITLSRYNYIDNKLWTQIKNQCDYIEVSEVSVLVSVSEMLSILQNNWEAELYKIKSVGSEFFYNKVNSIYFIWTILSEMENLQYVKLTKNTDKKYSRIINVDDGKKIEFDFKILSMTFRLSDFYETYEIKQINPILHKEGIIKAGETYARMQASELIQALDTYLIKITEEDIDTETSAIINEILEMLSYKVEQDNPVLLLITDY